MKYFVDEQKRKLQIIDMRVVSYLSSLFPLLAGCLKHSSTSVTDLRLYNFHGFESYFSHWVLDNKVVAPLALIQ